MFVFMGTLTISFEISDYWGIGKSVSRGFGTVVKTEGENISQCNLKQMNY